MTPKAALKSFMARFTTEIETLAQRVLVKMRTGPKLSDPEKLLRGSGKQVRHIRLESAAVLDQAPVKALMTQALQLAAVPFNPATPGRLIIRSVSAKQRPRRPKT